VVAATGGSTNGLLHLPAIANEAGIDFDAFDIEAILKRTPYIADLKPGGKYVAADMHRAGGVMQVLKVLLEGGFLHGDCMTVSGKTMAENLKNVTFRTDQDVVRPVSKALAPNGGVLVLKGNLAPDGAVVKVAGLANTKFRGTALCFDTEEDAFAAVKERAQFRAAVTEARKHDDEVMIERFIAGRELTVGILGGIALPVGEIIPKHEIYDYECKYTAGMAREEFPAKINGDRTRESQRLARLAFGVLKLRGYARIDFRMAADGALFCLEANTLPGMTELSLIPQGAAAHGISCPELCDRIVQLALRGTTTERSAS
jgi:hypothetical protein